MKQDVDSVMFVWREDDKDGIPEPDGDIWLAKSRDSGLGGVKVTFDPGRMVFVERPRGLEAVS